MKAALILGVWCYCLLPTAAIADDVVDLVLHHLPSPLPTSLTMRSAAASAAEPDPQTEPAETSPPEKSTGILRSSSRRLRDLELPKNLAERVVARISVGVGLDGGAPSGKPLASGADLDQLRSYQTLRIYGFGDAVLGTRGLGSQSLTSYFASQYRYDQDVRPSTPVPSVYDNGSVDELLVRSAYADLDNVFSNPILAPLNLRAGRQFRFGPAVAHFDGITLGYDAKAFDISLYAGRRVSMYGFSQGLVDREAALSGARVEVDFSEWTRLPVVVSGDWLNFDNRSQSIMRFAYRAAEQTTLTGLVRLRDKRMGREALTLRSRLSEVTVVTAELVNRRRGDFVYDLLLANADTSRDATDPRRYLGLGDVRPRTLFNLRGGTVLLKNIDLLLRLGGAVERTDESVQTKNSFAATYFEGGAALEARLRRNLRIGASALARRYRRTDDVDFQFGENDGIADVLPVDGNLVGERSFHEVGALARYTAGARRFTAGAEFYGRRYNFQSPYIADDLRNATFRGGGRVNIEGWAGENLRLRAEYDVSTKIENFAPELSGLKSLRVIAEGMF